MAKAKGKTETRRRDAVGTPLRAALGRDDDAGLPSGLRHPLDGLREGSDCASTGPQRSGS